MSELGMDVDATDDNEIDVIEHYKTLLVEYEIQQLYNQLFNRDYH